MKKSLFAIVLSTLAVSSHAVDNGALTAKISTLGLGLEYSFPANRQLDIGVNANYFNLNKNFNQDDLTIDGSARLLTFGVLGYYYPWNNGFNINGGLYYNGNQIDLHAKPKGPARTYTINGQTYSSNQIKDVYGSMDFNKVAPYLGIGWKSGRNSQTGFGFDANLGVMFHGTADVSFSAKCIVNDNNICNELNKNIEAERKDIQNDADDYKFYPVASIGFIYRF